MVERHNAKITSSELASLWSQYLNETMDVCMKRHALENMKDAEIRTLLELALNMSENHIQKIKEMLSPENHSIPAGFTEKDAYIKAQQLFSEEFWIKYINTMSSHGLTGYALALQTSIRADIREYFTFCNNQAMDLFNKSMDLLLSKGLFVRPPYIHPGSSTDFVKKESFLTGRFGERRPLNAIELTHITYNLKKSAFAKTMSMAFSQSANSKQVCEFMSRVAETADNHIEIFSKILQEDNLPSISSWDSDVTHSTAAPFSDKLIMYHGMQMISFAIAYYGAALSASMRRDLGVHYTKAIAKDLALADDGASIMIENGWLEKPPQAEDREALSRK